MKQGAERRRSAIVTVLLLMWVAAGVANANGLIMGLAPTPVGVITTSLMVCSWLLAGWLAGTWADNGLIRFVVVAWMIILVGAPLASWALNASPGMSAAQGGWVLPLLCLALAAPLYGLSALLPPLATLAQGAIIGVATLTMTLAAYSVSRHRAEIAVSPDSE